MAKPNGIGLTERNGLPTLQAIYPSRAEDKVWDAVEEAICAGWNPKRFITEAESAWAEVLKRHHKAEMEEFATKR